MASTQTVSPWAHGLAVFCGVVMVVGGAFQALEGLAGIVNDKYLVVLPNYLYAFDLTVWGVIHLLVGLALVVIGVSLLRGQTWARVAGIIAAAVAAILNFVWLPISPLWAIMVIAVDMLVIWALAQYLRQPTLTPSQDTQDKQAAMS
jgi:hypothetical protein